MSGVEQKGRSIVIGAMTRHADAANSPILQQALPGLAAVPDSIGDPQVRNRGTIGGSIANNDPNADYPAAVLGLVDSEAVAQLAGEVRGRLERARAALAK